METIIVGLLAWYSLGWVEAKKIETEANAVRVALHAELTRMSQISGRAWRRLVLVTMEEKPTPGKKHSVWLPNATETYKAVLDKTLHLPVDEQKAIRIAYELWRDIPAKLNEQGAQVEPLGDTFIARVTTEDVQGAMDIIKSVDSSIDRALKLLIRRPQQSRVSRAITAFRRATVVSLRK